MAREQQKSSYKRSHFMCCCPESFHPHVKHEKCRVTSRFQIEIVVRGILQLNTLTGCAGHRLQIMSTARPPTAPTGRCRWRRRQKPRGVIRAWFYSGHSDVGSIQQAVAHDDGWDTSIPSTGSRHISEQLFPRVRSALETAAIRLV